MPTAGILFTNKLKGEIASSSHKTGLLAMTMIYCHRETRRRRVVAICIKNNIEIARLGRQVIN